jgi:LEM3 (ligand-effect modulator 3) family / CDC50 family
LHGYAHHVHYTIILFCVQQLLGGHITDTTDCLPLSRNGSKILHPCGLIANTLFNDIISIAHGGPVMDETGIAWDTVSTCIYQYNNYTVNNAAIIEMIAHDMQHAKQSIDTTSRCQAV